MTEKTITERVARGAALLDEKDPGWWRTDAEPAIRLDALHMGNGCRCVVGQRETSEDSGYQERCTRLFGWDGDVMTAGIPYGFFAAHSSDRDAFDRDIEALGIEWVRLIAERRAAA